MKTHLLMMALASVATTVLIAILACGGSDKAAAPAANTPEPAAQCGRDSDCKGDRICDRGQCVSPR